MYEQRVLKDVQQLPYDARAADILQIAMKHMLQEVEEGKGQLVGTGFLHMAGLVGATTQDVKALDAYLGKMLESWYPRSFDPLRRAGFVLAQAEFLKAYVALLESLG